MSRLKPRIPLVSTLCAAVFAAMIATPSMAGSRSRSHRDPIVIVNASHRDGLPLVERGRFHRRHGHGHAYHRHISAAEHEYNDGIRAGRNAGFNAGHADGFKGRRFDDCAPLDPCMSRHFQEGYLWAYSRAYARGFDEGRCEHEARHAHSHARLGFRIRW